jgi:hypothetical protein
MIDSGATALFVDTKVAQRCGATIKPSNRTIRLADGTERRADGTATIRCRLLSLGHAGVCFDAEYCVAPLGGHEIILGTPWLTHFNPVIDWRERKIRLKTGSGCDGPTAAAEAGRNVEFDALRAATTTDAAPTAKLDCQAITYSRMQRLLRREQVDPRSVELIRVRSCPEGRGGANAAELNATGTTEAPQDPQLRALLEEFKDVMPSELPPGVVRDRAIKHHIELQPGSKPHAPPLRRYSPVEDAEIRKQVEAQLAKGHVRPSTSPWGAMVLLAKKKDGGLRFCVDYRALNNQTIKDRYALPLADDCFDRAQGARYFSKIDLHSGFWQIELDGQSAPLTAFRTRFGHFEYTVLPMGLCNAPATFMRLMNDVLRKHLDQFVLAFLDDIFIYSRSREEHLDHLKQVLTLLRQHKLYLKPSKCEWMKEEVEFLGHRIGREGLSVDPGKVDAVKTWPTPTDVSALRSFLGLAGYYRRFIEDYSKITLPLTELTKDEVAWTWGAPQQAAFDELKRLLSGAPVLKLADPERPYTIHCDASGYAVGSVLMQDQGNGLQPVSFISTKMKDAETRYAPHEQELLSLVYACKKWRHYLHGRQFTILSDHRSLQHFTTQPLLSARQARWKDLLAEFDFIIQYIEGPKNVVADALSRRHDHRPPSLQEVLQQKGAVSKSSTEFLAAIRIVSNEEADRPCEACALAQSAHSATRDTVDSEGPTEEALRDRARAAAEQSQPRDPQQPPPNRHGVVVMPTQRCTAERKGGGQCGAKTAKGQYCYTHRKLLSGTRIGKSTVPGAGQGLFVTRAFKRNQTIARYTGDLVETKEPGQGGPYYLEIKDGLSVDAARTNAADGRWANAPRGSRRKANARLTSNPGTLSGRIVANGLIKPGEEVFVGYGRSYWNCGRKTATGSRDNAAAELSAAQQRTRGATREPTTGTTLTSAAQFSLLDDLRKAARNDDSYPKTAEQAEKTFGKGCELRKGLAWLGRTLCVPRDEKLRTQLLAESHDSAQGGHFGRDKTVSAMKERFHWVGMQAQVERYVQTCDTCQRTKPSRQRKPGLLMPLPTPEDIDSHWTMDFVTGLPRTERGWDAVQGHFSRGGSIKRLALGKTTDTASDIAQRFIDSVVRHHGVPASIVSDRDPRLIKGFWEALMKRLRTTLSPSTSHHAESDGKSERDQQTMEQYLRAFCEENPKDWDLKLGLAELAMNSVPHASTGVSAYKLLYGREPATSVDRALAQEEPAPTDQPSGPAAEERWRTMRATWQQAKDQLQAAQQRMARQANKHRREEQFSVGDSVMLSTRHLKLRDEASTRKLTPLFWGPFPIKKVVNRNAYELTLPRTLQIHPVINISLLRRHHNGTAAFPTRPLVHTRPPPEAVDSNGQEEYAVERILGSKGTGKRLRYLVLWRGYGMEEATWEPLSSLTNAAECLEQYKSLQATLPQRGTARRGRRAARGSAQASPPAPRLVGIALNPGPPKNDGSASSGQRGDNRTKDQALYQDARTEHLKRLTKKDLRGQYRADSGRNEEDDEDPEREIFCTCGARQQVDKDRPCCAEGSKCRCRREGLRCSNRCNCTGMSGSLARVGVRLFCQNPIEGFEDARTDEMKRVDDEYNAFPSPPTPPSKRKAEEEEDEDEHPRKRRKKHK